jgi:pSer/pThr/pTyr-binding forkhead associated (FHA) protein
MWTLQSIEPAEAELTFRLLPGTLKTMGRAPGVDFVVDAALVSRVHCRFTISSANELELEDLGSTNGTVVNGKRVTKAMLSNGDQVTVGRVLFVVNSASGNADDNPEPTWGL